MELEGLSSRSPWTQTHSRGRARWEEERGHHSMMEVDRPSPSRDWSLQPWSHDHDPLNSRGFGADDDRYYESYGGSYVRSDPYHGRPT